MLVTVRKGNKGDPIAFVKDILCLFDRRGEQPNIGDKVDVMISHHVRPKYNEATERLIVSALIVRPVTADDVLISHRGFECSGSMCRTTARVAQESDLELNRVLGRTLGWLTPGRTPVIEVGNVNVGFNGQKEKPLIPGRAYVTRADVAEGHQRICGVPELDDLRPDFLAMLVRGKR